MCFDFSSSTPVKTACRSEQHILLNTIIQPSLTDWIKANKTGLKMKYNKTKRRKKAKIQGKCNVNVCAEPGGEVLQYFKHKQSAS